MALDAIQDFLKKFQVFEEPHKKLREAVAEFVTTQCHFPLTRKDVSIRGRTIVISAPPIAKSEIALKRGQLNATLKQFGDYDVR